MRVYVKFINRFFIIAFLVLCSVCLFVACGKSNQYSFEGLDDIHISNTVKEYDFKNGVTALYELEETGYTVDLDAITFGVPGEYEAIYNISDKYSQKRKVYIYGSPTFSLISSEIDYETAMGLSLSKVVNAEDSFGVALTPVVERGIDAGNNGYIEYGEHSVKFSATDRVGNKAEYECKVTVSGKAYKDVGDIHIDLVDVEISKKLDAIEVFNLFELNGSDLELLDNGEYTYINGYLRFNGDYLDTIELGEHNYRIVKTGGYGDFKLNLTDVEDATFEFNIIDDEAEIDDDDNQSVSFTSAKAYGHQRGISFEYTVKDADGKEYETSRISKVVSGEQVDYIMFNPNAKCAFSVTATAKRNGNNAGSVTRDFNVYDDVFLWAVNPFNKYENLRFWSNIKTEYSADFGGAYGGGRKGALHLTMTDDGVSQLSVKLFQAKDVPQKSKISFYIYNPTGVKLRSKIYTTNGYWISVLGGILTDEVIISEKPGWQKVTLTLNDAFNADFSAFTKIDDVQLFTEIQFQAIEKYERPAPFELYIGNFFIDTQTESISLNDNGFINETLAGDSFNLPKASSTDNRVTFEWILDGKSFDNNTFTFIPESGNHSFVVKCYFREELCMEKEYRFVGKDFLLPLQSFYTFNSKKEVILPLVLTNLQGGNAEYYVNDSNGTLFTVTARNNENVVIVPGNGEYVYGVIYKKSGEQDRTVEKTIRVFDERIIADWDSDDMSLVSGNTGANGVKTVETEYTTEKVLPGEFKSLKLDKNGYSELGNRIISLGFVNELIGHHKLVFWIYVNENSTSPITIQLHTSNAGSRYNYTFNGIAYGQTNDGTNSGYVVDSENPYAGRWSKVVIDLTDGNGNSVITNETEWINLQIRTNGWEEYGGYAWIGTPVIYLSNFYYEDYENLLVNWSSDDMSLVSGNTGANGVRTVETEYTTEKVLPGEFKSLKLDKTGYSEIGNRIISLGFVNELIGHHKLVFWMYVNEDSTSPITIQMHTSTGCSLYNYTVNGVLYGQSDDGNNSGYVVNSENPYAGRWSEVVIDLTDGNGNCLITNETEWINLQIRTNGWAEYGGYAWIGTPVMYLSNCYFID